MCIGNNVESDRMAWKRNFILKKGSKKARACTCSFPVNPVLCLLVSVASLGGPAVLRWFPADDAGAGAFERTDPPQDAAQTDLGLSRDASRAVCQWYAAGLEKSVRLCHTRSELR